MVRTDFSVMGVLSVSESHSITVDPVSVIECVECVTSTVGAEHTHTHHTRIIRNTHVLGVGGADTLTLKIDVGK